ncbi:MAG TPA: hypothetical protein VIZ17_06650 [Acetobacteraceae bacterium]
MRRGLFLVLFVLAGCSTLPSLPEQGFVDQAGWRHHQTQQDVDAIIAGMNHARAQSERMARQAP